MINVTMTDQTLLISFWLIFSRWLGFVIQLPLFENLAIPMVVKIFFSLIISFAFFPYLKGLVLDDIARVGADHFWILTITYSLIGVAIGSFIKVIMSIFSIAGTLIAQNIGLGAARYFDPGFQQRLGPFELFLQWTVILLVMSSGALTPMFKGMFLSFSQFSIANLSTLNITPEFVLEFFIEIISAGVVLALPIMITNLVLILIMGITSRSVPQMNILIVSFIINIVIGFIVFFITADEFFSVGVDLYADFLAQWFQAVS